MNLPHTPPSASDLDGMLVRQISVAAALCAPGDVIVAATGGFQTLFQRTASAGQRLAQLLPATLYREGRVAERLADPRLDEAQAVRVRLDGEGSAADREFRVVVSRASAPQGARLVCVEEITGVVADEAAAQRVRELTRLGALATTMAHEVRNPLAGISAAMQLVRSSLPDTAPHAALLTRAQGEVARLNALVEELVLFARPVVAQPRSVALGAVARAAADAVRAELDGSTPLTVEVRGEGRASADDTLLTAVLGALMRNAVEAGATKVVVEVGDHSVGVYDDGPGVPADIAAIAFQPFTTSKTRGTGLGLANATRAVEAMRGRLELVDSPLGGAGFRVTLRRATAP